MSNSMMHYADSAIERFKSAKLDLEASVLPMLVDKSFSLDDRWKLFELLSDENVLGAETYGRGHVDILGKGITLYDTFYIERYETIKYVDMLDFIDDNKDRVGIAEDAIIAWKEAVLLAGNQEFTNDW